jgi:hypothetical protein
MQERFARLSQTHPLFYLLLDISSVLDQVHALMILERHYAQVLAYQHMAYDQKCEQGDQMTHYEEYMVCVQQIIHHEKSYEEHGLIIRYEEYMVCVQQITNDLIILVSLSE